MKWIRVVMGTALVAAAGLGCSKEPATAPSSIDLGWFLPFGDYATDDPYGENWASSGDGTSTSEWESEPTSPPPAPYEEPLATHVANTVQWAGLLVTVSRAARVGGRDDMLEHVTSTLGYLSTDAVRLDPYAVYAELEVELANFGIDEVDYRVRDTWDLVLADGTRLTSAQSLGVSVLPGDSLRTTLHYLLPEDADLEGAALQLECATYGACEPERVPLDAELQREFPRRIDALVGKQLSGSGITLTFDEAMWDVNLDLTGRVPTGKRFLWMKVAVTADIERDGIWSTHDQRLSIDGRAIASSNPERHYVDAGTTEVVSLVFVVDATVSTAELRLALNARATVPTYEAPIVLALADTSLAELPSLP